MAPYTYCHLKKNEKAMKGGWMRYRLCPIISQSINNRRSMLKSSQWSAAFHIFWAHLGCETDYFMESGVVDNCWMFSSFFLYKITVAYCQAT